MRQELAHWTYAFTTLGISISDPSFRKRKSKKEASFFSCAHPFSVFADFNHIVSNISFVAFGVAFIVLVKVKAYKLSSSHFSNNQNERRGIIQQLGIFYVSAKFM
jgi:hypothetical protein